MGVVSRALGVDDVGFLGSVDIRLILLMSMVSSMGSIASPALPAMRTALGIDPAQVALVFTAFTLPAIVVLPAVGAAADIYSRRAVVVPGLLLFGGAGLAVGLVTEFWAILILRGLQGIGYTAFNALAVALLGDRLTGQPESAAQGVRVLLNKTTGFVGPTVAGVLAVVAWNYPFFLYGLAIPVGVLVYVYLEPTAELSTADAARPDGGGRRSLRAYLDEMAALVAEPFIVVVLAAGFFRMVLKYALYAFLALAVVEGYGGSAGLAGLLIGLYSLVGAVVASQSARFTGRFSHVTALGGGFAIAALAFVGFPLAGGLVGLTALVLVHGAGEGIINPVHKSLMSQSVATDVRAGLVTTNAIVQNVAKTITPVALGVVLVLAGQHAYDLLFVLTGVATVAAMAVVGIWVVAGGELTRRPAG